MAGNPRDVAKHQTTHSKDIRGPFPCSKAGCGTFSAFLYHLAVHEERCKMEEANLSSTSYRFALTQAAELGQPPSIIIINRSSSHPPKEWNAGTASIQTGLPIVGKAIIQHHVARTVKGNAPTSVSAILHSCSNCATRRLPSVAVNESMLQDNLHQRLSFHRAFKFTMPITGDIQAANEVGITPTLISVGLDGWACDTKMLLQGLQGNTLIFDLVLRLNKLDYGMSDKFADLHHGVWWISYDIDNILTALECGPDQDAKADELIAVWKRVQDSKDVSFGKNVGRNTVDTTAKFPTVT